MCEFLQVVQSHNFLDDDIFSVISISAFLVSSILMHTERYDVWARERCRISPPRFLAECCKKQLSQGSFVLLYFRLSTFSDLHWVCLSVFSYSTVLFVSISQVIGCEDRLRNDLYCVEWGVSLYSNQPTNQRQLPSVDYRSKDFIVGLTNSRPGPTAHALWNYTLCGQYPGVVPDAATVTVDCTNAYERRRRFRYVIVQFPLISDQMNVCEIEVFALGTMSSLF